MSSAANETPTEVPPTEAIPTAGSQSAKPTMSPLGGAVFLGMSWTWLIGMMLPVYLTRDFGWAGWVVFAVPNVLGAMAVGFLFRGREQSEAFEFRHSGAMRWFSIYTMVFHLAIAGMLFGRLMHGAPELDAALAMLLAVGLMAGVLLVAVGHSRRDDGESVAAAWVTLAISLGAFVWLAVRRAMGEPTLAIPSMEDASFGMGALALAAPAIVLGFLACPHLDLTIHRVKRCVPEERGRLAFGLGFGVFFLLMIVLTLLYAGAMHVGGGGMLPLVLFVHFGAQAAFTVGMHWRELDERRYEHNLLIPGLVVGLAFGSVFVLLPWADQLVAEDSALRPGGKPISQLGYEVLITAYALVFPAYLWTRVVVAEWMGLLSVNASTRVWWVSAAAASPAFAVGYVGQQWVWLAVGVGVLLVVPLVWGLIGARGSGHT